jgi:hypothetical protein
MTLPWRARCAPIIRRVLRDTRAFTWASRRRALRQAYPWGELRNWPYRVWCSEVRRQLAEEIKWEGRRGEGLDPPLFACGTDELELIP